MFVDDYKSALGPELLKFYLKRIIKVVMDIIE